mgnify:CR=1 FL=1
MGAYTPLELLRRWQQEELTTEQAMGHVLQIIQTQQQQLQAQQQRLRPVEVRLPADNPTPTPSAAPPDVGRTDTGTRRKKR